MKKLFLIILIAGYTVSGQNFFESDETETEQTTHAPFSAEHQPPANPDMGVDAGPPGNPGPQVPIDAAWPFLLLGGMGIGFYFLNAARKRKTA